MSLVIEILAYGTLILNIGIVSGFFVYLVERFTDFNVVEYLRLQTVEDKLLSYYREIAAFIALTATSGSLYMSEILEWTPCRLCWYQRIFMYPLAFIIPTAIISEKHDVRDYVIPLSLVGMPISLYNYSLERVEQFESAGCAIHAVSCSTEHTFHFGYVNVPFMAFTAFLTIFLIMWKFSPEDV